MSGLHVDVVGEGPDLVLFHGLPTPPDELTALAPDLPGFRVLVPHLPGYGRTPPMPGRQGVAHAHRLLLDALRAKKVERPALVGFSMGAYRALGLAGPLDARAVLLLGGFAELTQEERAGMKGFADALRAGVDVRPLLVPRFLSEGHRRTRPEDDALIDAWLECVDRGALIEELDDCSDLPSLTADLARLTCPIVARTGALDLATPSAHAERVIAAVADGKLEVVPGVAHALFIEDREATLDAIRRVAASQT